MLFNMRLPIVGMGLVVLGVAALTAHEWGDALSGVIAVAVGLVTVWRVHGINAYHRSCAQCDVGQLRRWERRYAIGSYTFAALIGLLNVRVLAIQDLVLQLIAVSLVFSLGAGIVSRISVRPVICVVSLLLATMPTVGGFIFLALTTDDVSLHVELFAIEAALITMITALSLQTVSHLYGSAVAHHTAKHDMAQLARHDPLTGLPNRLLLRERFQESSAAIAQSGDKVALHLIDLDGFKAINDGYGHPAGDIVLQQVSRRLEETVRAGDTVARLGGDEFIVIQSGVGHADEAEMLARRIVKKLSVPYDVEGETMHISASVGIGISPDFGEDLELLIACADAALYRSKGSGKGTVQICTEFDMEHVERAAA
jgi:diguanylate cyclase (GGDEF)-like protein